MKRAAVEAPIISRILRQARARRDTSDIPGFTAAFGSRSAPGLTQEEAAKLAGVSRRWYSALESGRRGAYSDHFLQAVRRTLGLSREEWQIVYRLARGHDPAEAPASPLTVLLPDAIRELVERSDNCPAYISDHRWDVLVHNARMGEIFPWMGYGLNVMEWALTWPEARTQLIGWEQEWALPMIAQLRLHAEQYPDDGRLREVIGTVRADPTARRLWDSPDLPSVTHPSSDRPRRLYLPQQGGREFNVRLVALIPMDFPSCRLMSIFPA
ncbi:helix-turn-helix domain-containing protein [Streptomyces sp. NPDC088789]|uniref:MmyB family transcriptional regulator n=1 Tax=Streptomyces sp. NPDC088789 TaxID=3365899 RepID=UPI0038267626